jgi:hypothetical protein
MKLNKKSISILCFFSYFFTFACGYDYHTISPKEIEKFDKLIIVKRCNCIKQDSMLKDNVNKCNSGMEYSKVTLNTKKGRILTINGLTPVKIFTKKDDFTFKYPIISELKDDKLIIAGSNLSQKSFTLKSIKKIEVHELSMKKTMINILQYTLGTILIGLGTGYLIYKNND